MAAIAGAKVSVSGGITKSFNSFLRFAAGLVTAQSSFMVGLSASKL